MERASLAGVIADPIRLTWETGSAMFPVSTMIKGSAAKDALEARLRTSTCTSMRCVRPADLLAHLAADNVLWEWCETEVEAAYGVVPPNGQGARRPLATSAVTSSAPSP